MADMQHCMLQDGTIPGVTLDACQGVTLQGPATLTYLQAQTPYAQMTILSVDPTSTYFQMQVPCPT